MEAVVRGLGEMPRSRWNLREVSRAEQSHLHFTRGKLRPRDSTQCPCPPSAGPRPLRALASPEGPTLGPALGDLI